MRTEFKLPAVAENEASEKSLSEVYLKIKQILAFDPDTKIFIYARAKGKIVPEQGIIGDNGQLFVEIGKNRKVISPRDAQNWFLSPADFAALESKYKELERVEASKKPYTSPLKEKNEDEAAAKLADYIRFSLQKNRPEYNGYNDMYFKLEISKEEGKRILNLAEMTKFKKILRKSEVLLKGGDVKDWAWEIFERTKCASYMFYFDELNEGHSGEFEAAVYPSAIHFRYSRDNK